MSDDDGEFFYDEGYYDAAEEYGTADDLVEHVIPSPVWTSYDPDWDMDSPASDLEDYFADEDYDENADTNRRRQPKDVKDTVSPEAVARTEPLQGKETQNVPELNLPERGCALLEPTVLWRSRKANLCPSPAHDVNADGNGTKVALLSDWRERFPVGALRCASRKGSQESLGMTNKDSVTPSLLNCFLDTLGGEKTKSPSSVPDEDNPQESLEDTEGTIVERNTPFKPDRTRPGSHLLDVAAKNAMALRLRHENGEVSAEAFKEGANGSCQEDKD